MAWNEQCVFFLQMSLPCVALIFLWVSQTKMNRVFHTLSFSLSISRQINCPIVVTFRKHTRIITINITESTSGVTIFCIMNIIVLIPVTSIILIEFIIYHDYGYNYHRCYCYMPNLPTLRTPSVHAFPMLSQSWK